MFLISSTSDTLTTAATLIDREPYVTLPAGAVYDAFEMIIFNILNNNEIYKEFDVVVDKKYELKLSKFCEINKYIDF